jgi:glyceraldehyde-3-phosphate dehydrogenase (ferredoxin)
VLPGSNRLVFTGISPTWGGFYVSTMGAASLVFDDLGLNYVVLEGRAPSLSVLKLKRLGGEEIQVTIEPVDAQGVWKGHGAERGVYALRDFMYDKYASEFPPEFRILTTGPASLYTDCGAVGSSPIVRGKVTPVDTWAGRGGMGSRMVQGHGVAGVIFGGTHVDEDLRDRKVADQFFLGRYGMKMMIKDKEATTKYRYDEELETGGTFGANFMTLGARLLAFNYRSLEWSKERRLEVYEKLVVDHYLAQFQEETIATRSFFNCGEPCPAICKKMHGHFKKDFEPYQALGPLSGIFDQRAAEKLNRHCDALGFDTIQVGGVIAWVMELIDEGLMDPADYGLSSRPVFSPDGFDVVEDSAKNATLGCEIADRICEPDGPFAGMLEGARSFAKRLGAFEDPQYLDRLVFSGSGAEGWMVPNQYWTPGILAPMPVMGKYFQYYGDDFTPPRTLGRISADRMVAELILDNGGFCRFHRKWAEDMAEEIFNTYYGLNVDFHAHHTNLARRINARNASVFWESERSVDLVRTFLDRKREEGVERTELSEWIARFDEDKWEGARDFWYEIRKGVDDLLGDRPRAR